MGQLHRLLTQGGQSRWSTGKGNAFLLAAFNYQLALRLLDDLGLAPVALSPKRRRWQLSPKVEWIHTGEIVWRGVDAAQARPLPGTRAFLDAVSDDMVQQVLDWAPPVVQKRGGDGTSSVVANYLSALLARQRRPGQRAQVRRLGHATSLNRALPEICQGIVYVLEPLFKQHRRRIAELTSNEGVAQLLSGYSRAQYFRFKDDKNG